MKLGNRRLGAATCKLSESEVMPGIIELSSLHVDEWHRRKGVANKLMDTLCEEADKARKVLMLMPDEEWLTKWYESHGFEQIQAEPLIMARRPY